MKISPLKSLTLTIYAVTAFTWVFIVHRYYVYCAQYGDLHPEEKLPALSCKVTTLDSLFYLLLVPLLVGLYPLQKEGKIFRVFWTTTIFVPVVILLILKLLLYLR